MKIKYFAVCVVPPWKWLTSLSLNSRYSLKLALGCKKSCDLDPLPFLYCLYIRTIYSLSSQRWLICLTGQVTDEWKTALMHPLLKKTRSELVHKNSHPIKNSHFVSKLTEKAVAIQLQTHMLTNSLFLDMQSAYRKHHSTETKLLKAKNDIFFNMDKGHVTLLVLLDLSAAFDSVNHDILIHRFQSLVVLQGLALQWCRSYVSGRSQLITINCALYEKVWPRMWGVSGFMPWSSTFTIYASKLFSILKSHLPSAHSHSYDTQLFLSLHPLESTCEAEELDAMKKCIAGWLMTSWC